MIPCKGPRAGSSDQYTYFRPLGLAFLVRVPRLWARPTYVQVNKQNFHFYPSRFCKKNKADTRPIVAKCREFSWIHLKSVQFTWIYLKFRLRETRDARKDRRTDQRRDGKTHSYSCISKLKRIAEKGTDGKLDKQEERNCEKDYTMLVLVQRMMEVHLGLMLLFSMVSIFLID